MLAVKAWILAQSASCSQIVLLELQAFTQMHLSETRSEEIYRIVTQKYPKSVKILRAYVRYSGLHPELLRFWLRSSSLCLTPYLPCFPVVALLQLDAYALKYFSSHPSPLLGYQLHLLRKTSSIYHQSLWFPWFSPSVDAITFLQVST